MQSSAPPHVLVLELLSLETNITSTSLLISQLLSTLVANASRRIEAIIRLETFRADKDRVLALEGAMQDRNREMLQEARQEIDRQALWTESIRILKEQAMDHGVDVARLTRPAETAPSTTDLDPEYVTERPPPDGDWDEEEGEDERIDHLQQEQRLRIYQNQYSQMNNSLSRSEARLSSLLARLRHSQSLSTTRAELTRLHALANRTTVWLAELSLERRQCSVELQDLEGKRVAMEERLEEKVLDLVLGWSERKRRGVQWSGRIEAREMEGLEVAMEALVVV